jgi:hypothetical protein
MALESESRWQAALVSPTALALELALDAAKASVLPVGLATE